MMPAWSRKAVRAVLPASAVDAAKKKTIHVLYERHAGTVLREARVLTWARRTFGGRPVLYHLDVHVTDHCNMQCRGCSHFSNISEPYFADPQEFAKDLRRMAEIFAGVREIFLLGGEPLLHPQVDEFVRIAHECFPKAKTYLFTNSLLVTQMPERVWEALAETEVILYCDRYPVNLPFERIDAMAAERGVALKWTEDRDSFFTIPIDLEGAQDAAASHAACNGVDNCINLRHGRLYPCARIAYIDIFRDRFGIEGLEATEDDSISIYGEVRPWEIMDFLLSPVAWCRHCDQDNVTWYPWSRGAKEIEQWTCPASTDVEHVAR
jgi:hypothetical protein